MAYEALADLILAHKREIARKTAEAVHARNLRLYSDMSLNQLVTVATTRVETIAGYIRSGKVSEYRDAVKRVTEERRQQGYSAEEINAGGMILAGEIKKVVERELAGPENATTRTEYLQRIESLTTLGKVSAFNTLMKKGE